jgi:hypothetical protein
MENEITETIPGKGWGEVGRGVWIKENDERWGEVNSTTTYLKNVCKCHIVPQYDNNKKLE